MVVTKKEWWRPIDQTPPPAEPIKRSAFPREEDGAYETVEPDASGVVTRKIYDQRVEECEKLRKRVAELEARAKSRLEQRWDDNSEYRRTIDQLKQRVAELEEEIEFTKTEAERFKDECLKVVGGSRQRRIDDTARAIYAAASTATTNEPRYLMTPKDAYNQAEALEAERERRLGVK